MIQDTTPRLNLNTWRIRNIFLYDDEHERIIRHTSLINEGWCGLAINRISRYEMTKLRERYAGRVDVIIDDPVESYDTSCLEHVYLVTETSA